MATVLPTRRLGSSDLEITTVGLGCNAITLGRIDHPKQVDALLGACLDTGIAWLDTAALYGGSDQLSETLLGQMLRGRRDEFVIATKCGHSLEPLAATIDYGLRGSRTYIRRAVEGSLRRLRTDWIDLFQIHEYDDQTPLSETVGALEELVAEGKIRAYGHSNFPLAAMQEAKNVAEQTASIGFVSAQDQYSLLQRGIEQDGRADFLTEHGVGLLPYYPLASGILTGKYRQGSIPVGSRLEQKPERLAGVSWSRLEAYRDLCRQIDAPMAAVSLAWLLTRKPVTAVIAGARSPEQVHANAYGALLSLDDDVVAEISEIFAVAKEDTAHGNYS
ncbi:MAG: aldo/keto reductase [Propionibacteriaceae bacterium]